MKQYRLGLGVISLFFGCLACGDVYARATVDTATGALSPTQAYEQWMSRLRELDVHTLFLLAQSDCRLADLESECYVYYHLHMRQEMPEDLSALLRQKRQTIDNRRIYIDSLYYLQALQALNAKTPDWARAEKSIEQALTHNRFFVRAVMFHWTQLQRTAVQTGQWTACLAYAQSVLPPLGWIDKIRALGDALYLRVIEAMETQMQEGLYQDALNLYDEMKRYLRPEFPLFYQPYREQNLLHTAYQGIFGSYYAVAEKAFGRGLYRQAQQQALAAYDYYQRHETYMNGVNVSLSLLEKILADYRQFMRYADEDEKAYYAMMADTITGRTGLSLPPLTLEVIYDMDQELRLAQAASDKAEAELAALTENAGVRTETVGLVKSVAYPSESQAAAATAASSGAPAKALAEVDTGQHAPALSIKAQKWSMAYAQKQWDYHVEQARLLRAKRQFIQAREAYAMGDSIRRYYPVRTSADYKAEMEANELLCTEQLLNKAQYRLWQNDERTGDSLYRLALAIVEQTTPERRTPFYSLLEAFETQKTRLLCQQRQRLWSGQTKEIRRQLGFGQENVVDRLMAEADSLLAQDRLAATPCLVDTAEWMQLRQYGQTLRDYHRLLDSAHDLLAAGDSVGFVSCRLAADRYFDRQAMQDYVFNATTLFSDLSYERNFPLLEVYARVCIAEGWETEADFVLGYLKSCNYNSALLDQLRKKVKKAGKGGE